MPKRPQFAQQINDGLTRQARLGLLTVTDLDAFLAAPSKAECWHQWGTMGQLGVQAKRDVVRQMLQRKTGDWTECEIADWVAYYDAQWGLVPTGADRRRSAGRRQVRLRRRRFGQAACKHRGRR
ncbi:MAG TPA: hypothetical protein VFS21_15665 [Roseiflexaceae bacterium]|nr:hypothetical protein [Roseiflexaceae bacterium]